jgi:hypothetical protein
MKLSEAGKVFKLPGIFNLPGSSKSSSDLPSTILKFSLEYSENLPPKPNHFNPTPFHNSPNYLNPLKPQTQKWKEANDT